MASLLKVFSKVSCFVVKLTQICNLNIMALQFDNIITIDVGIIGCCTIFVRLPHFTKQLKCYIFQRILMCDIINSSAVSVATECCLRGKFKMQESVEMLEE